MIKGVNSLVETFDFNKNDVELRIEPFFHLLKQPLSDALVQPRRSEDSQHQRHDSDGGRENCNIGTHVRGSVAQARSRAKNYPGTYEYEP